ncbi:hypothetical protein [Nocardiopsis ganjiahuensis]|uniref:hypothetical protein n=1 Tax=Nocardiopsis ganjiahuensis TaxID=239984 RepID=UPI00034B902F|nr:hypothetical protein [Nocardiopsis ganjiahuensis]
MAGLKDRLLSRERPVATYPCRVASVEDTRAAEQGLAAARKAAMAVKDDDKQGAAKAKKLLDAAEKKRDACYEQITLRALPPGAFEDLGDAYPEAEADDSDEVRRQRDEEYLHAVFLASVEGDLTTAEWTEFVQQNLSTGERNDLFNLAIAINGRVRALDPATPKGSTATRR